MAVAFLLFLVCYVPESGAYTHDKLPVNFLEHNERSFELARKQSKPIFLLISAVWCYWCKIFEEKTLTSRKVYSYLNNNFVNIFIDADISRELYFKYQADALPYIVFLTPDGSPLHKYGGVLYADDFLELITMLKKKASLNEIGKSVASGNDVLYSPPKEFKTENVDYIRSVFMETFQENFDGEEFGIGGGKKLLLPQTFLYLLRYAKKSDRKIVVENIRGTIKKAVGKIYDPLEGGFFRYAETRDWRIPHYEKMLDVNSSAVLLLLRANAELPSPELKGVASKTISYLSSNLYDEKSGAFMGFQVADASYYLLSAEERKKTEKPSIVKKIFVDKLSLSLVYLLDTLRQLDDTAFERKVKSSMEFLAGMVKKNRLHHYYSIDDEKWLLEGTFADRAYLALLFSKAFAVFKNPDYRLIAKKLLDDIHTRYYSKELKIYMEKSLGGISDLEYLMELNSVIAHALLLIPEIKRERKNLEIAEGTINYFSGMGELLNEKSWSARDFGFMETYARYLAVAELYLSLRTK